MMKTFYLEEMNIYFFQKEKGRDRWCSDYCGGEIEENDQEGRSSIYTRC